MRKKLIPLLILVSTFMIFLSCSSKPLPDQGVKILQPQGGVVLKAGDSYEILWKVEPVESEFGAMVTIDFSRDGGKSWGIVQENVQNSGKYIWNIPKVRSGQCKVRAISQFRAIYRGTSELFSVM